MISFVLGLQRALAQATGLAPASRVDQSPDRRPQDGLGGGSQSPDRRPQDGLGGGSQSPDRRPQDGLGGGSQSPDRRQQDGLGGGRSFEPSWRPHGNCEREKERKDAEEEVTKRKVELMEGRSSEDFALHSVARRNDRHANRPGKRGRTRGSGATDMNAPSLPTWSHGRTRKKEGRATQLESHSLSAWDQESGKAGRSSHPDSRSVPAWDLGCGSARIPKDCSEPCSVPAWNQGRARVENVADGAVSEEEIDVDPEQERLSKRLQATLGFRVEGDDSDSDYRAEELHNTFHEDALILDTSGYVPAVPSPSYEPSVPTWNHPTSQPALIEEEDDGWMSGDEGTPQPTNGSSAAQHLVYYDNDVWVDEAKAAFAANKENTEKLKSLLREMFSSHGDVFSLVLAFVRRSGKNRQAKLSLPRIVLAEFEQWREEKKSAGQEGKIPLLTPEHQREALEILIRCHPVVLDPVCSVFNLYSADREQLLSLVRTLLDMGKLKEAVTYAWKFHLQDHFSMEELLIPLIAMDKINLIENYIGEEKRLQEQFVMLLDRLCGPGTSYKQLLSLLTAAGVKFKEEDANSKLNSKQLHKLGIRLVRMFNLELDKFPNLSEKKASGSLHYLLQKKYVEGEITDSNIEELIEATVQASPQLGMQLVVELVRYRDLEAAARWAHRRSIPLDYLPAELQGYIMSHSYRVEYTPMPAPPPHSNGREAAYHELSLPLERVFFVDGQQSLAHCQQLLIKPNAVIGVDAEWRLPVCNRGIDRMAVLQLAVRDAAFLLDMVNLPKCVPEKVLRQFMMDVFGSNSQLKLGYSIDGDFNLLARSWTFVADIVACPERVVDLKTFANMVQLLPRLGVNGASSSVAESTLPQHPLLGLQQQMPPDASSMSPKSQASKPEAASNMSNAAAKVYTSKQTSLPRSHSRSPGCVLMPASTEPAKETVREKKEPEGVATSDADRWRGLSALVMKCFGKPLDKSQQLSDWERRPLRLDQVKYAALDAFCLLEVYEELKSQALAVDPHFNLEPTISSARTGRAVFKKQKEDKALKKTEVVNPPKWTGAPICPRELSVVVDTMLQGVGRYLRCCGVNVKILTNQQSHYDAVRVCLKENRIILTSGSPYSVLQDMVPRGMCVHIGRGKARDQVLEVLDHFNVCVREKDILSRCQVCNGDEYVRISKTDFRELIASRVISQKSSAGWLELRDSTNTNTCRVGSESDQRASESAEYMYKQSDLKQETTLQGSTTSSESIPLPRLPRSSLSGNDSIPFVRLGDGLSPSDNGGVIVNHTGVTVQVQSVPEGIQERVTEYYCCVSCGKVFWEGKHFAQVIQQFQHVLEFSSKLSQVLK